MRKILLASLLLFAVNLQVGAQNTVKPAAVAPATTENVKNFNEKVAQAIDGVNTKDAMTAQSRIASVVGMMMDRANDLSIAKAPQSEVESRKKMGQQLKYLSIDPVANKTELVKLMKDMQAQY